MNFKVVGAILFSFMAAMPSLAFATDHHYPDNNKYFASKYHHRHSQHWQNETHVKQNKPAHWGRHHHHGIHLDGHDGRP